MRFYRVGQTCSHHSIPLCRWSQSNIFSILIIRHTSHLLDRIRGGYFQLVCVLPPNETWSSQLRSRRSPFGLEGLDPEASQHVLQCRLILAFLEDPGGDVADGPASIWSCHEYQMLEQLHEREELHVFASSPRRITEDPGRSSPTFPTCWLDCRQVGRLCRSLTQGWCAKVRFQSVVAVRTSRRKKQSPPQFRTRQTQF